MTLTTSLGWEKSDWYPPRAAETVGEAELDPVIRRLIQRQEALGSDVEALDKDIQRLARSLADYPTKPSTPPSLRIRELNAFRARMHRSERGRRVWLGRTAATALIGATAAIGILLLSPGGSSPTPAAAVATASPNGAQSVPVAVERGATSAAVGVADVAAEPRTTAPTSAIPTTTTAVEAGATRAAAEGGVQPRISGPSSASPITTTPDLAIAPLRGSAFDVLSILVEWGNTVGILAVEYTTSTGAIVILNDLADPDLIIAGQYLDVAPGYDSALDDDRPKS